MKLGAIVAGTVLLITSAIQATEQDALARLRAALGGETALGRVQAIRARGTIANKPLKNHFDLAFANPGRFVKVIRGFSWSDASWITGNSPGNWQPQMGPKLVGGGVSAYEDVVGFDGQTLIPARSQRALASHPELAAVALDAAHASLAEFVLPLLGSTPSSYPVEPACEDSAIMFRAAGNREWRLELDQTTHLPSRLSWSYPLPSNAPATAKRTLAVIEFSDYRFVGTLRWPHRLITTIDGRRVEDATVTRYDVNGKIPEEMFRKY